MEELRKACRERKSNPFAPLPIKFQFFSPYQVMFIQAVDNVQIAEKSPGSNENSSSAIIAGTEGAESSSGVKVSDSTILDKVSECWCGAVMRQRENSLRKQNFLLSAYISR